MTPRSPTCVHCPLGDGVRTSKQQQTARQVQRDPTAGKQYEHQRQGAGQPPLPEQKGLSLGAAVPQAALQAPEDPCIEECYDQQGLHDAPQEVEVHHEGEGDDREEGAGPRAESRGRGVGGIQWYQREVVPAKEKDES